MLFNYTPKELKEGSPEFCAEGIVHHTKKIWEEDETGIVFGSLHTSVIADLTGAADGEDEDIFEYDEGGGQGLKENSHLTYFLDDLDRAIKYNDKNKFLQIIEKQLLDTEQYEILELLTDLFKQI